MFLLHSTNESITCYLTPRGVLSKSHGNTFDFCAWHVNLQVSFFKIHLLDAIEFLHDSWLPLPSDFDSSSENTEYNTMYTPQ
jgi:hypothetical protein